jgi:PAS domain S-box-containing protein
MKSFRKNGKNYLSNSVSKSWHIDRRNRQRLGGLYNQSLDLLQDGVVIYDRAGVIHQTNPAARITLGMGELDILKGRRIQEFIPKEFVEEYQSLAEIAEINSSPVGPIEMELLSGRGCKIHVRIKLGLLKREDEQFILLNFHDITEWKSVNNELLQMHFELEQSYWGTLDGWGRALELRDDETEGHTRRVTEKTVDLAMRYGVSLQNIQNIRHGALLHDIGKMAIPDSILLKPGPLNPEEWLVMKRHPVYALELLKPIPYLQSSLGIPYSHHEKWDGSGYPLGLKGADIPLSARLFAVVDVWDALLSNRPYRAGWPLDRVLSYIRENSGTHFEPDIVELFLRTF